MNKEIAIKVPTKLILSGEWAVLEPRGKAISLAINRFVYANIKQSLFVKKNLLDRQAVQIIIDCPILSSSRMRGSRLSKPTHVSFDLKSKKLIYLTKLSEKDLLKLKFVQTAIEVTLQYLLFKRINIKNFELNLCSNETLIRLQNGEITKIGLGSSAAVVVATVKSILKLHKQNIINTKSLKVIYKISMLAHFLVQGKLGSGVDVATSTFGRNIFYILPSKDWLDNQIALKKWMNIIVKPWPNLIIKSLLLPFDFNISVCFSGISADTKEIVLNINKFKKEKKDLYLQIVNQISAVTVDLIASIKASERDLILNLINLNAKLLRDFSNQSCIDIEISELKMAIEAAQMLNCAGKFSGAGGGDCSLAISFKREDLLKVEKRWQDLGLYTLDLKLL